MVVLEDVEPTYRVEVEELEDGSWLVRMTRVACGTSVVRGGRTFLDAHRESQKAMTLALARTGGLWC